MFEGTNYSRRKEIKHPPFVVIPKSSNNITIYPNELISYLEAINYTDETFQQFDKKGWNHFQMEQGTYGMYANVKARGKEKAIKVTMTITK